MELSDWIGARLAELGWQQKRLAIEWHQQMGSGELSTFETRLSKLMGDKEEGFQFLFGEPNRLGALAAALEVDADELGERVRAQHQRLTVVLDPRLPSEAFSFLERRARLSEGAWRTLRVEHNGAGGEVRELVRDVAEGIRNVIVAAAGRDQDFFKGAGLRTSEVEKADPGYSLVAFPELTTPLPPRLYDDDGTPMVPDPELEKRFREHQQRDFYGRPQPSTREWRAIERADGEGRAASFRLDWLAARPTPEALRAHVLRDAIPGIPDHVLRSASTRPDVSYLWFHGDRVLELGHADPDLRARVAEHHEVHPIASLVPLVAKVKAIASRLNPWGDGGEFDLAEEITALHVETGIEVVLESAIIRDTVLAAHLALTRDESVNFGKDDTVLARVDPAADERFSRWLDDLLGREFVVTPAQAAFVFQLQAVRCAPLVHLTDAEDRANVVAIIGAGRLLQVELRTYPGEQPGPVRVGTRTRKREDPGGDIGATNRGWDNGRLWDREVVLDGNDIHIVLRPFFFEGLEGTAARSVPRRREEAAASD